MMRATLLLTNQKPQTVEQLGAWHGLEWVSLSRLPEPGSTVCMARGGRDAFTHGSEARDLKKLWAGPVFSEGSRGSLLPATSFWWRPDSLASL